MRSISPAERRTARALELDSEDVRYNFIRWLSNDMGTAIGPSRVNPNTGQILDADVILTDGWIRHFWTQYNEIMPELAMEGLSPETVAWLDMNPRWDPRVRMADPADRPSIMAERMRRGMTRYGGLGVGGRGAETDDRLMGTNEFDGLVGTASKLNGLCLARSGQGLRHGLRPHVLSS
jgi:hypothetical protein